MLTHGGSLGQHWRKAGCDSHSHSQTEERSEKRRSAPEEPPKTWAQIIFFPLSLIALGFMALMLLIYVGSTWLVEPAEPNESYGGAPSRSAESEFQRFDANVSIDPPLSPPEQSPAGGILIEQ